MEKGKLCVKWEAPPPLLAAQMEYEVDYQIREGDKWMVRAHLHFSVIFCSNTPGHISIVSEIHKLLRTKYHSNNYWQELLWVIA